MSGSTESSRARILGKVRVALRRTHPLGARLRASLGERPERNIAHPRPAIGSDLEGRFVAKVDAAAAEVERLMGIANVSRAVLDYVVREDLDPKIVIGDDPLLASVRWPNELQVERRAARDHDRISVTTAFAGIAETGTCVLVSDRTSPTTLNFLPEHHIVLLERSRIVGHLEDAFARLRAEHPALPRTVNFITGPSRTGDVELTMEFGAHGPRRLYVLLVDTQAPERVPGPL